MNRRNFIVSSVMGAGALSMFPTSALASNNGISISSIGKGFGRLLNKVEHISISDLSSNVVKTHERLITSLNESGYLFNATEVVKLNSTCYAIPLHKKPMLGFESKELALIVKNNGVSKFYILNEKLANEFAGLVENVSQNAESHEIDIDAASFAFPVKVVAQKQGRETTFTYQNKFDNTIMLRNTRKNSAVLVS
jgi:ribosomal protein L22